MIVLQSTLNEIQKTLVDIHGVKMKLIFEPIPDNDLGTADSLRNLKGKIKVSTIFLPLQLFFGLDILDVLRKCYIIIQVL